MAFLSIVWPKRPSAVPWRQFIFGAYLLILHFGVEFRKSLVEIFILLRHEFFVRNPKILLALMGGHHRLLHGLIHQSGGFVPWSDFKVEIGP